jgi:hypothetical protein
MIYTKKLRNQKVNRFKSQDALHEARVSMIRVSIFSLVTIGTTIGGIALINFILH